jgi:hypothetical protein
MDGGHITGRKANGLRPEFEALLHEAEAAAEQAPESGKSAER